MMCDPCALFIRSANPQNISMIVEMFLRPVGYFNKNGNMKKRDVLAALAALAQENRLDAYRLLVQAGPEGISAGEVAAALGLPPNTLTFHFDRLREAGLVSVRREGRSMIYAAQFERMNDLIDYLTENCCGGTQSCRPERVSTKSVCD